ncbi:P-loop containing nucleoside triphosphate hydrolase protein [Mycena albidolilacea]|uniref:Peroxisomal ATPase PEX1 n=1 Tax=Mycena albidolilacea TaxID=1033008 RepID=A0AAD7EU26_9AGAR|nr:P-loop containing nucleoside triphosphate hydrolase protein [Mycena albidolilacea]
MPRQARVHYVSLKSSLVNLPISLYGPLVERSIRPQHLAVHLTLVSPGQTEKLEVYVGWTGMASASSLAQFNAGGEKGIETIEIDPQYALGLGLKQHDLVEIGLVHDLPLATSVATEPLTADDWDIIDIHASHVESTLLSQVRVAKMGQEMDVWVLGRTRVRLRVVSIQPESKGSALLLTTNTEVSIAPKLHSQKRPQVNGTPNGAPPATATAAPNEASVPSPPVSPQTLRVLPPHLLGLPFPEHTGPEVLAYVSPATFSLLHPSAPIDETVYHKTPLKRLHPPADPSAPSPSAAPPVTRVLNAAGTAESSTGGDVEEVYVRAVESVPESHVAFISAGGIEDWDLVRLSRPSESDQVRVGAAQLKVLSAVHQSPTKFLAGVDDILRDCSQFCVRKFAMHASVNVVHGMSSLLVTGRSGAGKTSIVQAVAKTLQQDSKTFTYTLYVDVSRYAAQPVHTIKTLLNYWFRKAAWHRPAILILDNLEKLVGVEVEHADSFRTRHITELFVSLFSASARAAAPNSRGVVLLATAASAAALHPVVNGAHLFEEVVNVKAPNKGARKEILARIVHERLSAAREMQLDTEAPLNYAHIATQTEGYSATDLQDLVARAVHQVAVRAADGSMSPLLASTDFDAAQVDFVPLSLRDVKLQKSEVSWADIGGLRETRQVLRETLEWPIKYGPIFAQSPLRLRSGLLLYGFPGCGKTLLASAVAKECGLNFISVKGPEILNKYIGASEQSVRDLFERASAAKPCVLFFDEFDSIAPKRGHDSTGVTDRVVNQMLTQMDGAEGLDGVYVLAATSRPDLIDSALLRPGRLDKSLFCDMPDLEDRKDILQAVARKVALSRSVEIDEIAAATEGYSGADLQALMYNAHLEVVHSSIVATPLEDKRASGRDEDAPVQFTVIGGDAQTKVTSRADEMALQRRLRQIKSKSQAKTDAPKGVSSAPKTHEITSKHLSSVLKTMRPSVSAEERARLDRIYRGFISDRSGEMQVPPEAGGVGNRVSLM